MYCDGSHLGSDYVRNQNTFLNDIVLEDNTPELRFWREHLKGTCPAGPSFQPRPFKAFEPHSWSEKHRLSAMCIDASPGHLHQQAGCQVESGLLLRSQTR